MYKVAVAYGVVSWLLIQIATQVFPIFEIPNWAARLIVLLLALGFPIALVLAWIYELTPEGITRTTNVAPDQSIARSTGRKLDVTIILVLLTVIAVLALRHPSPPKLPPEIATEKSVALLPFENQSEEPANAYFAAGVQDEILTRLSRISDLKVISRTSTERYKSAPANLTEIATQLHVSYLVEGSVQKSGNQVRVNVQMIRAATGSQVWADTLDRELTDIFSVESEIAQAIAQQLSVTLSGAQKQTLEAKATEVPAAYDEYLRGLAFTLKAGTTPASNLGAQKHLREAVRLDPKFALAWALLANVDAVSLFTYNFQPTEALMDETQHASEMAFSLQPDLGEALLAKGYYNFACLRDYPAATDFFLRARQALPNNSRVPEALALVTRRQGLWEQSDSYFEEAEGLDPRNPSLLTQHALSYVHLRRFPDAVRKLDQVLDITPDDIDAVALKGGIAQAQGDLRRASSLLTPLQPTADHPNAVETQAYEALLERHPEQMVNRLREMLMQLDPKLGYINGELRFWLGWLQDASGDHQAAQASWQEARRELSGFLGRQPKNVMLLSDLALTSVSLGDKAAALAFAERAAVARPVQEDAVSGPIAIEVLARIAARTGDVEGATTALQRLLKIPYDGALGLSAPLTPALLRLDPMFDPLRSDRRFQQLTVSKTAK
ncbi:MAG: hypothetical protein ABI233_11870 [Chthoniobacterales bacterium]